MLWDIVYDFFVHHIFGGVDTQLENTYAFIGFDSDDNLLSTLDIKFDFFKIIDQESGELVSYSYNLGNYLSLIATIITIVIIVTLCALFIWKMVKLIGGLIR